MRLVHKPPRRSSVILASLFLVLLAGCRQSETKTKESSMSETLRTVEIGTNPDQTISGEQSHPWTWTVPAGHVASIEVEQMGIDVVVRLFPPGASEAELEVDGLGGAFGTERLSVCPDQETEYRLEIQPLSPLTPEGRYRLTASDPRPATADDCLVAQAERTFDAAERQRRLETGPGREAAVPLYEAARDLYSQAGDDQGRLACLQRLAWLQRDLGEKDLARSLNLQLIDLAQALGEHEEHGNALNRLGNLDAADRKLDDARARFEEALSLSRQENLAHVETFALNNLALLSFHQEDMVVATQGLQDVAERWQTLGEPGHRALALSNLGVVLQAQGEFPGAVSAFEEARDLRHQLGDKRGIAKAWLRLANVRYQMNDLDAAEQAFQEAAALGAEGLPGPDRVATANDVGLLRREQGRPDEAQESFEEALSLAETLELPFAEAMTLLNLAALHQEEGRQEEGLPLLDRARALFSGFGDQRHLAACDLLEGQTLLAQGNKHQALVKLDEAARKVEEVRLRQTGWALRMTFFSTRQAYYDQLVDLLLELDSEAQARTAAAGASERRLQGLQPDAGTQPSSLFAERALQATERRSARSLLDALVEAPLGHGIDGALVDKENRLSRELAEVSRQLQLGTTFDREDLLRSQERLVIDLDATRAALREANPQYADLTRPNPLTVEEIQSQVLDHETRLLVYSLGEERSFLFTLTRAQALKVFSLPGRKHIEGKVAAAVVALQDEAPHRRDRNRHLLEALSDLLLGPLLSPELEEGGPIRRLAIVADGALQTLPFAALPEPRAEGEEADGPRPWLLEVTEVVHLPSASSLAALRREVRGRPRARFPLAVFADPVFSAEDPRLKRPPLQDAPTGGGSPASRTYREELVRLEASAEEAEAIADLMGKDRSFVALDFKASRETFAETKLEDFRILHFATHGFLDAERPELSGLALSLVDEDGRPTDGFIRTHELYSRRFGADLAVLSACRTGLGRQVAGEGTVGLPRGFLYAGVPRVIVSLWNVADDSTAALMKALYEEMESGRRPPEALHEAQKRLLHGDRERHRHPKYWAPFVFLGEWLGFDETAGDDDGYGQGGEGGGSLDPPAKGLAYDQEGALIPIPGDGAPPPPPSSLLRAIPDPPPEGEEPPEEPPVPLVNGVDGQTGRLLSPDPDLSAEEIQVGPREYRRIAHWAQNRNRLRLPVYGVDPEKLGQAGWAVIYGPDVSDEVKEALEPLLTHRKAQAGGLFKEHRYDPQTEGSALSFLEDLGVALGPAEPAIFPYYVLLVGDPQEIPFRFQYELDVQYAVGRLHLPEPEAYHAYAQGVKRAETSKDTERPAVFWGTQDEKDESGRWLMKHFVQPLAQASRSWRHTEKRGLYDAYLATDGRRETLARFLGQEPPALLFTGCHGLTYKPDSGLQEQYQGSLICEEWQGEEGPVPREAFFAAEDLPQGADLAGLILFSFACYSSGCAHRDPFGKGASGRGRIQAKSAFVSALSQRLLTQGAQAVVGHVDRAWPDTFTWKQQGDQKRAFVSFLRRLLEGQRLGHATEDLNTRYADFGSQLWRHLEQDPLPGTDSAQRRERLLRATLDARAYTVIGDPAVRLVGSRLRRPLA